jgi:hypothetical protein
VPCRISDYHLPDHGIHLEDNRGLEDSDKAHSITSGSSITILSNPSATDEPQAEGGCHNQADIDWILDSH